MTGTIPYMISHLLGLALLAGTSAAAPPQPPSTAGCSKDQAPEGHEDAPNLLQMKLDIQDSQDAPGNRQVRVKTDQGHRKQVSDMWQEALSKAAKGMIPEVCQPDSGDKFARLSLEQMQTSSGYYDTVLIMDLTNALAANGKVSVMVTAMVTRGTYDDEYGYLAPRGFPLEETESTMLELRLSEDKTQVEVHKPASTIRTSDRQSRVALKEGLGDGWLDSLDRLVCSGISGEDRIIVDASPFLLNGFYVMMYGEFGNVQRISGTDAFPNNFDVTAEFAPEALPYRMAHQGQPVIQAGFSVVRLPDTPMPARANDDRLLYFDTQFQDKGYHEPAGPYAKPSAAVDSQVSMIWRYNLPALPGRQIRIYVDPSVPRRWRSWFREGIEAWNTAYELAGWPNAVKAVLPFDSDWPKDYNIADARFNTISWDFQSSTSSMGIAKVDPRSGEIIKSDIIMADTWVKAWLSELDRTTVNVTHLITRPFSAKSPDKWRMAAGRWHEAAPRKGKMLYDRRSEMEHRQAKNFGFAAAFVKQPMNASESEALLGSGLRDVVMHETGHILGLRHNFKGSMAVSRECLQDKACTSKNGLSSSVMDYLPLNLPTEGGPDVDVFSPVVGAYDKLAIRFGYMNFTTAHDDKKVQAGLEAVLQQAEDIQVCYDYDQANDEDPSCVAYDLSSDPVAYYEDQLKKYADLHNNLLEISVAPNDPYELYGQAVHTLMSLSLDVGEDVMLYVGGINNSYLHRTVKSQQAKRRARQPVDVAVQRRALAVLTRLFRPQEGGLLPPKENWPYLVDGLALEGIMESLDLSGLQNSFTSILIFDALRRHQLFKVHRQEQMGAKPDEVLSVAEYLSTIVSSATREGFENFVSFEEQELQRALSEALVALMQTQPEEEELPSEVVQEVQYQIRFLQSMTEAALERLSEASKAPASWQRCAELGEDCNCTGLLRLGAGSGTWSAAQRVSNRKTCTVEALKIDVQPMTVWQPWCECLPSVSSDKTEVQRIHLELINTQLLSVVPPTAVHAPAHSGAEHRGRGLIPGAVIATLLAAM